VLVNLLTNALHALSKWPKNRRLKISTRVDKAVILLKVEDSGPGIPGTVLPHIFEPFFTTKEVGSGTGLGLSIAHSILSEHNGRLYYEPSPEGGAGFAVELPIVSSSTTEEEPENDSAAFEESVAAREAPAARILVLDDEQVLAELLAEILSDLGHTPVVCCSALRALELVKDQPFDLILSDFRMPVMNGQEFYTRVRQSQPALARRIVFLTGDVVNQETRAFLGTVGNRHLAKPFRLDTIAKVISEMLPETREPVSSGFCAVAAVA
jgi:CheY-like chemotaxis protein